jgi:hypothetical protein
LYDIARDLDGELKAACKRNAPREELFDAFVNALNAEPELAVVVIEDVHWADEASLDLIRHTWRRAGDARVLMIVTYRDDGLAADPMLRTVAGDLATYRGTRRMGLAPLSAMAVAALAADSSFAPDDLHRLTGGNPFFVSEVRAMANTSRRQSGTLSSRVPAGSTTTPARPWKPFRSSARTPSRCTCSRCRASRVRAWTAALPRACSSRGIELSHSGTTSPGLRSRRMSRRRAGSGCMRRSWKPW